MFINLVQSIQQKFAVYDTHSACEKMVVQKEGIKGSTCRGEGRDEVGEEERRV